MAAPNQLICFLGWALAETAMRILYSCVEGALPYAHYVTWSPSQGVKVLHSSHDPSRPPKRLLPNPVNGKLKQAVPWWFFSRSEGRSLQRRCQPTPTPAPAGSGHIYFYFFVNDSTSLVPMTVASAILGSTTCAFRNHDRHSHVIAWDYSPANHIPGISRTF